MPVRADDLLRRLEPAVRPMACAGADRAFDALEEMSFDDLLALARGGSMRSGEPVEIADPALHIDRATLERLGVAVDALAARSVRRALVVADGRPLVIDVATRTIERELDAQGSPNAVVEVEAAMRLGVATRGGPTAFLGPPNAIWRPGLALEE